MAEANSASCETNPLLPMIEAAYRRWFETKGASVDEVLDLLDDEVEMRSVLSPDVPHEVSGTHVSKKEAAAYFSALLNDWEMIGGRADRFVADGDDIVMIGRCHWRNRATGGEVDSPKVDVWHFENGKVKTYLEMFDSLAFAQAIGAV